MVHTFWEFVNEWDSGNAIDTHGQGIPLGGPLWRGDGLPIDEERCGVAICVHHNLC